VIATTTRREREVRQGRPVATRIGACGAVLGLALALAGCTGSTGPVTHQQVSSPGHRTSTAPPRRVGAAPPPSGGGLSPAQIRAAYDLGPLLRQGIDGRGQTIVIVDSFGSPTIGRDLAVFDRGFGLPPPPSLRVIQPAGAVPPYRRRGIQAGEAGETTLDVEWAHVMAPGAKILLVETPTAEIEGRTGFPQIVTAEEYVIRHHLGGVISQSFGATEGTFRSAAAIRQLRGAYQLAASPAYRVTVLASTGDTGAAGQTYNLRSYFTTPQVGWPASDPLVTAVGGTQLDLAPDGTRRGPDVAWSGSGGGRSAVFARPAYQNGVAGVAGHQRGIPDISMNASCASGVAVFASYSGAPSWSAACGTSVAAPLFAGIVALADQQAGHTLGLINPALYAMAAHHDRGIVDIRRGNNSFPFTSRGEAHLVRGFTAQPGYDLVSGVGTVDAALFVPELARTAG
jgi:subtilase family serine protease